MLLAQLNTKKRNPFLFCVNYFARTISSKIFLYDIQEGQITPTDSWISKQVFSYFTKSLRNLSY